MMEAEFNHLNSATWECNHVVFTAKYRKKLLFGKIWAKYFTIWRDGRSAGSRKDI
jgi:REP element-mobilizing transposase RayT